jgi:hypothetical protein
MEHETLVLGDCQILLPTHALGRGCLRWAHQRYLLCHGRRTAHHLQPTLRHSATLPYSLHCKSTQWQWFNTRTRLSSSPLNLKMASTITAKMEDEHGEQLICAQLKVQVKSPPSPPPSKPGYSAETADSRPLFGMFNFFRSVPETKPTVVDIPRYWSLSPLY